MPDIELASYQGQQEITEAINNLSLSSVPQKAVWFDSVASMVAYNLPVGVTAATRGYHTVNDGGSAYYYIREVAVGDVEDGGSIIFLDNGNVAEKIKGDICRYLFPKTSLDSAYPSHGDCQFVITPSGVVLMIDSSSTAQFTYLKQYMIDKGIKKVDYFLLTHYHADHYGNIQSFINQNDIDFTKTKWLIPDGTNSPANYTTVTTWLAGKDVTVVNTDRTIDIDYNVTMDLFCCSNAFRTWMTAKYYPEAVNENDLSIQAVITHGGTKAYYTGDMGVNTAEYLLGNYDLPNVDILKVPHHGEYFGNDNNGLKSVFARTLNPRYSVYNVSQVGGSINQGTLQQYVQEYGEEFQVLDDAEFVSDGQEIIKTSNNKWRTNGITPEMAQVYIDANYDGSNGISDGTATRPFTSFISASYAINSNTNPIRITFDSGNYDVELIGIPKRLYIYTASGTVFDKLNILDCPNVHFATDVVAKNVYCHMAKVWFESNFTANPVSSCTFLQCSLYVNGTATIDGTNATSGDLMQIFETLAFFNNLVLKNGASKTGVSAGRSSVVGIINLTVNTLNSVFATVASFISIIGAISLTSITQVNSQATMPWIYTLANTNHVGISDARPDTRWLPKGYFYYDTTLSKLVMWDGSNWVNVT